MLLPFRTALPYGIHQISQTAGSAENYQSRAGTWGGEERKGTGHKERVEKEPIYFL
jgi:hypothetical protein